jgi:hypothetical protein
MNHQFSRTPLTVVEATTIFWGEVQSKEKSIQTHYHFHHPKPTNFFSKHKTPTIAAAKQNQQNMEILPNPHFPLSTSRHCSISHRRSTLPPSVV